MQKKILGFDYNGMGLIQGFEDYNDFIRLRFEIVILFYGFYVVRLFVIIKVKVFISLMLVYDNC